MEKFTVPYQGPPAWLDAARERSVEDAPHYPTRAKFIDACMSELLSGGFSPRRAANVTANAINESGWGRHCGYNNPGGWKITRSYARDFECRTGRAAPWWKAPGNVESEDEPWCFYRCFDSLGEFLRAWCEHFVPKPDAPAPAPGYRETGNAFWAGDDHWFGDMILAGYKGRPSTLRMRALRLVRADDARHPSVRAHRSIVREVLTIWAQRRLGLDPDGAWGPKSRAVCSAWQVARALPASGDLDVATLTALRGA